MPNMNSSSSSSEAQGINSSSDGGRLKSISGSMGRMDSTSTWMLIFILSICTVTTRCKGYPSKLLPLSLENQEGSSEATQYMLPVYFVSSPESTCFSARLFASCYS